MGTAAADSWFGFLGTSGLVDPAEGIMPAMPTSQTEAHGSTSDWHGFIDAFCDAPMERKAVIDLSKLLAKSVGADLQKALPMVDLHVGETEFGGTRGGHHLDIYAKGDDGLRLGIDVKGLNSGASVTKNWRNRVLNDFVAFATKHHQTYPSAVLGGVLVICADNVTSRTIANIEKALKDLNGRRATANVHGLLECVGLAIINKRDRVLLADRPSNDSGLRIEGFARTMASVFNQRWRASQGAES
jgi:hypothetical protein